MHGGGKVNVLRLALAVSLAILVTAAGKPLSIALTPKTQTVTEGQSATFSLTKSGGNGKPSIVRCSAGTLYNLALPRKFILGPHGR
jgi:hypothetical protein